MRFSIRRPDDMHVHLREGAMLKAVAPHTARRFGRALVMPNTSRPVLEHADVVAYRTAIAEAAPGMTPLMTIKLVPSTTPRTILGACGAGAVAGKLYPEGVTTNSEDGVSDVRAMYPVFEVMQERNMVLCLHGEHPSVFCLDREEAFLATLADIADIFPKLRIVLEHVTTAEAVEAVEELPENVAATITAHHLVITLDDVIGGKLAPHNFCKPVAKRPQDRKALIRAATSGNPKFFFGSDSAPHARGAKECASGCAGCYTAPLAVEILAKVWDERGLDPAAMAAFTSEFGASFYGLSPNEGSLDLVREEWTVPDEIDGVVPFMAGQRLEWRLE